MPIYDLRRWQDEQGADKPGVYGITDPSTLARFSVLLTPYVTAERPLQSMLAGDQDPANPAVTVPLSFPDWTTAREVEAEVNGPPAVEPPGLPEEVPLYRIKVVMRITPSAHGGALKDRVPLFIESLAEPDRSIADELWSGPTPTLMVNGAFAQGFKAWEDLSDEAWAQLISQAVNMAL